MPNYDQTDVDDDAGAYSNARDIKIPFNKNDIKLWFSLIESKMQFAGIGKQWSKRQVLVQLIPAEYHNDFKSYLIQQQTEAGADAYYALKSAMVKQFGPKKADGFDKAISRVMNGTPSQLGRQILNDICPNSNPLAGCHCADVVLGIWRRSLPTAVRNAVADMDFTSATYLNVFDKADSVWAANAATTTVAAALSKTTEVAAASSSTRGNRGGRGQRGGRGGGRGAGSGRGKGRGPRHSDNPPEQACNTHWKFGKGAWHCADRHACPWRDYENPKPKHNRNIAATETEEIETFD